MTKAEMDALPPADAEQRHVVDEIENPGLYDVVQHGEFPRCCGEACACQPRAEAGR